MKKIVLLPLLFQLTVAIGQDLDSTVSLTFSGYADIFYQFDLNRPTANARPAFLYNHNRHHEVNVNLAYLKGTYTTRTVRANLAFMAGTYPDDNLGAESSVTRHIYEANAGVHLGGAVWIDAGIMPSHIGFESAVSRDCRTLTRSLAAENSPYFETGVKVTYQPQEAWMFAGLYLNGWQRVARRSENAFPAFGTQITWKPKSQVTLNYSTFLGSETPDSNRLVRHYHNVYGIFALGEDWEFTAGLDFGAEQLRLGSGQFNTWYSAVVIVGYRLSRCFALAARAEYFEDKNGVIVVPGPEQSFKTSGFSLNFDYQLSDQAIWRTEGRMLNSESPIFVKHNGRSGTRPYVTTSLAISF